MERRLSLLAIAVVCAFFAACSKCGKSPVTPAAAPAPISRYLPKAVEAAVVVPDVAALGEKIKLLQDLKTANFVAQLQGFTSGTELATSFMQQLGVDLRSREEIEKIGIDPSKGAGVALLPGNEAYSVVAVKDEAKLRTFLKNLAANRLGASVESTWEQGGVKVVTWARSGTTPALGYVVKDGFAFIAPNATAEKIKNWAALTEDQSLSQEPPLTESLKRLPETRDLYVYAPQGSELAKKGTLAGGTIVANLAADGLTLISDFPWPNTQDSLNVLQPANGPNLFDKLPKDAFAVARFGGDPALLAPFLPHLIGPYIEKALKDAGIDANAQILQNLKPGIAVAVSVANTIRFDRQVQLDVRRTNPFTYAHLTALGQVKDAAQAQALFDKLPEIAPKFGAQMEKTTREGVPAVVTHYAQGEGVHFALIKDTVVAGSPLPRFDEAVAMVSKGEKGPGPFSDPSFEGLFKDRSVAVLIDLHRLADSVRNLPGDAWGPGGGFVKAGWMRWLDGMDDLRAITVSVAGKGSAVQAEISLRFSKK
ncbi:MAG: hypothetical protein ACJ790_06995 [Myxococcaceae bacterium]